MNNKNNMEEIRQYENLTKEGKILTQEELERYSYLLQKLAIKTDREIFEMPFFRQLFTDVEFEEHKNFYEMVDIKKRMDEEVATKDEWKRYRDLHRKFYESKQGSGWIHREMISIYMEATNKLFKKKKKGSEIDEKLTAIYSKAQTIMNEVELSKFIGDSISIKGREYNLDEAFLYHLASKHIESIAIFEKKTFFTYANNLNEAILLLKGFVDKVNMEGLEPKMKYGCVFEANLDAIPYKLIVKNGRLESFYQSKKSN